MSLSRLLKKGGLRELATVTVATVATVTPQNRAPSVASVATVSVANPQAKPPPPPRFAPPTTLAAQKQVMRDAWKGSAMALIDGRPHISGEALKAHLQSMGATTDQAENWMAPRGRVMKVLKTNGFCWEYGGGWLITDNEDNGELRLDRLRALEVQATPAPAVRANPSPTPVTFDPGPAALLALAMAYCDCTGASDKARSDWARDVQDTPPELRGDLYAHLREQLPPVQPRPVPAPAPAPAPAKPATWLDVAQPWRVADAAYLAHWGQCPACQSATRHGERCPTGQQLHDAYAQAVRLTH